MVTNVGGTLTADLLDKAMASLFKPRNPKPPVFLRPRNIVRGSAIWHLVKLNPDLQLPGDDITGSCLPECSVCTSFEKLKVT